MPYDVARGMVVCGRDWSMGAGGTPTRSLAYHAEMQRRDKVMALAKLVDVEIKNNASIAAMRTRAGTMLEGDETRFNNFVVAWHSWQAKNLTDNRPTSPATIADLERWRSENIDWARRLTTAMPLPPSKTSLQTTGLTRPDVATSVPAKEGSSALGLVLGLSGAILVFFGLAGRR